MRTLVRMRGRLGTRETVSKPISFSLLEKETVFGIQRKRGFWELGRCEVSGGGLRLYAPMAHRPRPLRPVRAEQGKAAFLSCGRLCGGRRGVGRRAAKGRPYPHVLRRFRRGGLRPPAPAHAAPRFVWGATTPARPGPRSVLSSGKKAPLALRAEREGGCTIISRYLRQFRCSPLE